MSKEDQIAVEETAPKSETTPGGVRRFVSSIGGFATLAAVFVAVSAIVATGIMYSLFKDSVGSANSRLSEVNEQIGGLRGKAEAIEDRIKEVDQKREALSLSLTEAEVKRRDLDLMLTQMTETIAQTRAERQRVQQELAELEKDIRALHQDPKRVMELLASVKKNEESGGVLSRLDKLENEAAQQYLLNVTTSKRIEILADCADYETSGRGARSADEVDRLKLKLSQIRATMAVERFHEDPEEVKARLERAIEANELYIRRSATQPKAR